MTSATWHKLPRLLGALLLSVPATAASGCDFYDGRFNGEFNAGGADPYNFPPPFRGTGATRQTAASGVFTESGAYVKGKPVGYFSFPFAPSQVLTTGYPDPASKSLDATTKIGAANWPGGVVDPLRVTGPGTNFRTSTGNPVPVPSVYNFDPPGTADPFAPAPLCTAPSNYTYDAYAEAFPQNQQWNVFTFLPDRFASFPFGGLATWSYRPVVAEVPVTTKNLACQSVKSERTLLSFADQGKLAVPRGAPEPDGSRLGAPTPGRLLAWALIDPGAAVVRVGQKVNINQPGGTVSGTSVQKYGWYGQFIVSYIDGGYIPTEDGPKVAGAATTRMRAQRLYYPRSRVFASASDTPAPGALGAGYDVLQAGRFTDGASYSPVCEVWTYALPNDTKISDLPKSEADIIAQAGATLEPARTTQSTTAYRPNVAVVPSYVFCLQAAPLP